MFEIYEVRGYYNTDTTTLIVQEDTDDKSIKSNCEKLAKWLNIKQSWTSPKSPLSGRSVCELGKRVASSRVYKAIREIEGSSNRPIYRDGRYYCYSDRQEHWCYDYETGIHTLIYTK